jgi:hypothetical protein
MKKKVPTSVVPANPANWSPQSQRSVSAEWTKEYTSFRYNCWRCRASALFSAEDQRYTYEVKKAPIDQNRILCEDCWRRSNQIAAELAKAEKAWAESKQTLQLDKVFLERWAHLLDERDEYVPYRSDTAKKNMLARLLRNA